MFLFANSNKCSLKEAGIVVVVVDVVDGTVVVETVVFLGEVNFVVMLDNCIEIKK
jgi:hypothetical protein